jgi:hypothetical protein
LLAKGFLDKVAIEKRRPCTDETIALIWVPQVAFLGAADPGANRPWR